jgi:hypothetical protein
MISKTLFRGVGALALLCAALLSQAEEMDQSLVLKDGAAACSVGASRDSNRVVCGGGHFPHFASEIAPGDPGSSRGSGGGGTTGKSLSRFVNGIAPGGNPAAWWRQVVEFVFRMT